MPPHGGIPARSLWENLWSPAPSGGVRLLIPALRAAEGLFRIGVASREALLRSGWIAVRRTRLPIVSVGGLEVGGVGKTPLVLELYRLAVRGGLTPAVLTRGYGGSAARRGSPERVPAEGAIESAGRFGDEPVWLAEQTRPIGGAGVWVSPDRGSAADRALDAGATLGILDDGFQHRALRRQGEIVALSGGRPLANRRLLPSGPLREPPSALGRAQRIVLSGVAPEGARAAMREIGPYLAPSARVFSWTGRPAILPIVGPPPLPGEKVRLLAGIAHAERLFGSLATLGHSEVEARIFPDHHPFRPRDLEGWLPPPEAGAPPPPLLTTEKDWARLRSQIPSLAHPERSPATATGSLRLALLRQTVEWNEPEAEEEWIRWLKSVAGQGLPEASGPADPAIPRGD